MLSRFCLIEKKCVPSFCVRNANVFFLSLNGKNSAGEKPYVCTVAGCGKRFTEYSSLYKHHVVHTHTKPYICNHCGKTYRQTSTLAMHKRTTHGDDSGVDESMFLQQAEGGELKFYFDLLGGG